jgi:GNAT superfamily N-acetyltransferase
VSHHNFDIRLATPGDAERIAELWAAVEPNTMWARLGPRLARLHWERYCHGSREIAVTAWRDGTLAGVCLGTDRPHEPTRRYYREHAVAFARALAREALHRPLVLPLLAGRLAAALAARARRRAPAPDSGGADPLTREGACYMANFFVAPAARGQQLGTELLERFADEMAQRGCRWCVVHTTADNVASQRAQERAGFECVRRHGDDLYFLRSLAP